MHKHYCQHEVKIQRSKCKELYQNMRLVNADDEIFPILGLVKTQKNKRKENFSYIVKGYLRKKKKEERSIKVSLFELTLLFIVFLASFFLYSFHL